MVTCIQAFEVDTYLRAIQSEVQQKKVVTNLNIANNILWPEVSIIIIQLQQNIILLLQAIIHFISKRFAISKEDATIIYNTEDYHKLGQLAGAS